jgi:hypothetical protein
LVASESFSLVRGAPVGLRSAGGGRPTAIGVGTPEHIFRSVAGTAIGLQKPAAPYPAAGAKRVRERRQAVNLSNPLQ